MNRNKTTIYQSPSVAFENMLNLAIDNKPVFSKCKMQNEPHTFSPISMRVVI